MSKHTRLKAARRKQHNKSAKARAREWAERCAQMRREGEAARLQRTIQAAVAAAAIETKITEPLPPTDPLSLLLEGCFDGSKLPAGLYYPDGTLNLYNIVQRVRHLGGVAFIDTEGTHGSKLGSDPTPA